MVDLLALEKERFEGFTYEDWARYFAENDKARLVQDFSREPALPSHVRKRIFPSIGAFRQGEASEGRYLRAAAEGFPVPGCAEAIGLFIKEENWHAAYLARFMEHHGAPQPKPSRLDKVFRWLRRLGGLRCQVTVLVTAEMLALTYYDALGQGSGSPALSAVCGQMLRDEGPHVVFQSHTLRHYRNGPGTRLLRRVLMDGTALAVWGVCRKVYRAGGYGFARFWRENRGYLEQSIAITRRK